jgi:general secretion pathway protein K
MKHHLETMFATDQPGSRRRGVALVTVLWVLALLALIAASFATSTRTEIDLARNQVESAKAEALAEAGVYQAIVGLIAEGGAEPWRVDGSIYAWHFATGEIRVAIRDEGGKIDLNTGREDILRGLFRVIDLGLQDGDALVDAILDFRDADSLRRVSGAEDSDYEAAGLEHDAKDAPFEIVEELQQVYGMSRAIYEQVAPYFTVYSRKPAPDPKVASGLVLEAVSGQLVAKEDEDVGGDGLEPGEISPEEVSDTPGVLWLGNSAARSGVPVYTIHAEGRMPSRAIFALEAVVRLGVAAQEPYQFYAWRRAKRELFEDKKEEDEENGSGA